MRPRFQELLWQRGGPDVIFPSPMGGRPPLLIADDGLDRRAALAQSLKLVSAWAEHVWTRDWPDGLVGDDYAVDHVQRYPPHNLMVAAAEHLDALQVSGLGWSDDKLVAEWASLRGVAFLGVFIGAVSNGIWRR
jgi:hypothetical protein